MPRAPPRNRQQHVWSGWPRGMPHAPINNVQGDMATLKTHREPMDVKTLVRPPPLPPLLHTRWRCAVAECPENSEVTLIWLPSAGNTWIPMPCDLCAIPGDILHVHRLIFCRFCSRPLCSRYNGFCYSCRPLDRAAGSAPSAAGRCNRPPLLPATPRPGLYGSGTHYASSPGQAAAAHVVPMPISRSCRPSPP